MNINNIVELFNTNPLLDDYSFLIPLKIDSLTADTILISGYDTNKPGVVEYINRTDKKVILDYTREIVNIDLDSKVLSLVEDLSRVTIYSNGYDNIDTFNKYKNTDLTWIVDSFFVRNYKKYIPTSLNLKNIQYKPFLFQVGKHRSERIQLLNALYDENLISHGHVSFIPVEKAFDDTKADYSKVQPNLFLDVKEFTRNTSHTKHYVSDYYRKCEFVIICETDLHQYDGLFITEKTTKAIQLNKKVIILGGKGILDEIERLYALHHNMDIKHLTRWCDTSYDKQDSVESRIKYIVKEVKKQVYIYNKKHLI